MWMNRGLTTARQKGNINKYNGWIWLLCTNQIHKFLEISKGLDLHIKINVPIFIFLKISLAENFSTFPFRHQKIFIGLTQSPCLNVKSRNWSLSPNGTSTSEWSGARYLILPGNGSVFWWDRGPRSNGFNTCPFTVSSQMSSKTTVPGGSVVMLQATSFP